MKVLIIPSQIARKFHTTSCCAVQRSAPLGLGCTQLDVVEAQRQGYTWCGHCRRSERVVA